MTGVILKDKEINQEKEINQDMKKQDKDKKRTLHHPIMNILGGHRDRLDRKREMSGLVKEAKSQPDIKYSMYTHILVL